MEVLGIGPAELLLIVVLALIILGPKDMQKAGRSIGRWLRQLVTSDGWKFFQQTSREIQTLPNRLMREAALEELKDMERELRKPVSSPEGGMGTKTAAAEPRLGTPTAGSQPEPRILGSAPAQNVPAPPNREEGE